MSYEKDKREAKKWRIKNPPQTAKALVDNYLYYMSHREFMRRFNDLLGKTPSIPRKKKFIDTIIKGLLDLVDIED